MRALLGRLALAGVIAGAGVWVVSQPPPPATSGELQFPQLSTPYTCTPGRQGRVYYDTDDDLPYFCDDTTWVTFGITISGTNPYLARFTSAGTNVETSDVRNTGVPVAGSSGDIVDISKTINAANGSDTIQGLVVSLANASHTGAANVVNGFNASLTGAASSNATEIAYGAGGNWDYYLNNNIFLARNANIAAATTDALTTINSTLNAMDGSDRVSGLLVQLNNGASNHTGTSNFVYGIRFTLANPEADATEAALNFANAGSIWDYGIYVENAWTNPLIFNANSGGADIILIDATDSTPTYLFKGNGADQVTFQAGSETTTLMGTDLSLSGTTLTIDPNANIVEVFGDGSDTVSIITAPTSTSHTERVTFICQDADVTFNDADAAGAAGTIDLAGAATNFTCSADDTITFVYYVAPVTGNARWVEVSRSVN